MSRQQLSMLQQSLGPYQHTLYQGPDGTVTGTVTVYRYTSVTSSVIVRTFQPLC